ncbi:MAG: DUF721 domain-containing protein [Bacteroidales bacterium]|nr:DUF721 domain-containing protein [Bacteroidales bacterium]
MTDYNNRYRLARKDAVPMDEIISMYIRDMKLSSGLFSRLVEKAWDEVSGLSQYTLSRYFRDGVLHCRMSSSVVRNSMKTREGRLCELVNARLCSDPLYDTAFGLVKSIELR